MINANALHNSIEYSLTRKSIRNLLSPTVSDYIYNVVLFRRIRKHSSVGERELCPDCNSATYQYSVVEVMRYFADPASLDNASEIEQLKALIG